MSDKTSAIPEVVRNTDLDPDIFIDNCVATHFNNPADEEYKKLIKWLYEDGILIVSNKLLTEYNRTLGNAVRPHQLLLIIAKLTQESRLKKITNRELGAHGLKEHQVKRFTSNLEDHHHIFLLIKSARHIGLSLDTKLREDAKKVPGFTIVVEDNPSKLNYDSRLNP